MSLRARLQMTKLHHKLGFIKFIITSEVIIIVPLAEATLAETTLAEPTLAKTVPTKAWLKSIKVVYQGLHHLVLHQLPPWGLNCCWVPFPYPSTSAHTRAEWLHAIVAREVIEVIVVVTKVFCFSVHVGEVLLVDTVPLCSVAHFRTCHKILNF